MKLDKETMYAIATKVRDFLEGDWKALKPSSTSASTADSELHVHFLEGVEGNILFYLFTFWQFTYVTLQLSSQVPNWFWIMVLNF
jgi:hypothetical protein